MRRSAILIAVWLLQAFAALGQNPSPSDDVQQRLRALEEQVRALQAEIAALKAAAPAAPTPVAQTGAEQHHEQPLPVYGTSGAKVFNPDIGMIGNFVGAVGRSRGGSEAVAPLPLATLQESEASFQAVVDPYARADFFLAIGEQGIEVEEGYVTFPTVPGGLLVKAGKMRASFGRLNQFHNHTLPWIDRPLVMFNLLGGNSTDPDTGIKDAGISVSKLLPTGDLFLEATGEIFRGDSGALFRSSRRQDFSAVGKLRAYLDMSEATNLEIGTSYARGHNDQGSEFLTQLNGLDLTFRWKPLQRAIYRSLATRAEIIWSRRQQPGGTQRAFGFFVSTDYQVARRWFAGLRYDWSERARAASIRDRGFSAVLTFWPSEFTQIRGQYRRTIYDNRPAADEFLFQALFTIGAHGAHPF